MFSFKNNCTRCHSNYGTDSKILNLTTEKKQAKWKDGDEKLVKKITGGGFGLPKFGKKLKIVRNQSHCHLYALGGEVTYIVDGFRLRFKPLCFVT